MAFAYHQEALRKRRILERKHIAQKLIADEVAAVQGDVGSPSSMLIVDDKVLFTDRVENIQNRQRPASQEVHSHKRTFNQPTDEMNPILHPKEYNFKLAPDKLPPRKPHFKV